MNIANSMEALPVMVAITKALKNNYSDPVAFLIQLHHEGFAVVECKRLTAPGAAAPAETPAPPATAASAPASPTR